MTTESGTATETAGAPDDGADPSEKFETILHHRVQRALKKEAPELMKRGQRALVESLGLDPDTFSVDSLKEHLEKANLAMNASQKQAKELQRLLQERDEHASKASAYEAQINARAVSDAISDALAEAKIIPGAAKQIVRLVSDQFRVVDGKVVAVGADGEPLKGKDATKIVSEFLAANTHFLSPTAPSGGAGSKPPGPNGAKASEQRPQTRDEIRAAFTAALQKG